MQGALCGLLLATIGLAALVTHEKRLALRLPLRGPLEKTGQLIVSVPRDWAQPAIADQLSTGEIVSVDEIVPDQLTGRRLTVQRLRTGGLIPPLQLLLRDGYLSQRDLLGSQTASANSEDQQTDPARVQPLTVAGWPGVMVSYAFGRLGSRHVQKQVLACSSLPNEQAVVIRLEGPGLPDAADEELVRQIAETTAVRKSRSPDSPALLPQQPGTMVKLDNEIWTAIPPHFVVMPTSDPNCLSRDLLANRSDGSWTAAELIPCVWLSDEPAETQILTLLTARDPSWRSATVTRIGDNLFRADQPTSSADSDFPIVAYCMTNGVNQALVAIVRGGWREQSEFDETWKSISSDVRFIAHRDIAALLDAGESQARQLRDLGLEKMLPKSPAQPQHWSVWDQSTNVDKQDWMQLDFIEAVSSDAPAMWRGRRFTIPTYHRLGDQAPAESIEQSWTGTNDLSTYRVSTDRIVSNQGAMSQQTAIQRWAVGDGKLQNEVGGDGPHPPPKQFVPGAWLPLIMGHCSDGPMILRTESFWSCDGSAPPGLLTLLISGSTSGEMRCLNVTVNGSGRTTRWWYTLDDELRYIDFTSGWRAQRSVAGPE